jgi:hypothetical protein
MFSALNQGSLVYILDKSDGLKFKTGEIVGITQPKYATNTFSTGQFTPQTTVDLKVKVDGSITDYNSVPSTYTLITYNNGNLLISESKQALQPEVETILHNSKSIVENISKYERDILDCESILKELNPQFAKDKARDEQITSLSTEVSDMKNTLNQIVTLLSNNQK